MTTKGLDFLRALYQCRELSAAVIRFGGQKTLKNIENSIGAGLAAVQECLGAAHYPDISSDLSQVAELVLKDVHTPDFEFACSPCEAGIEILSLLQHAVFGSGSRDTSFMRCVKLSSRSEAKQARDLCLAALLDALSAHNALSLLSLGRAAGCRPLHRRAYGLAASHFTLVTSHDYAGLVTLSQAHMRELLSDDAVRVASEAEVFRALCAWTEADAPQRAGGDAFLDNFCSVVRLPRMGPEDLAYVEAHPLVLANRAVLTLVANAFLCRLVGAAPATAPFGKTLDARPRTTNMANTHRGRIDMARQERDGCLSLNSKHPGHEESSRNFAHSSLRRSLDFTTTTSDHFGACSSGPCSPLGSCDGQPWSIVSTPCVLSPRDENQGSESLMEGVTGGSALLAGTRQTEKDLDHQANDASGSLHHHQHGGDPSKAVVPLMPPDRSHSYGRTTRRTPHRHSSVFEAALCRLGRGGYTPARLREAAAAARDLGGFCSPSRCAGPSALQTPNHQSDGSRPGGHCTLVDHHNHFEEEGRVIGPSRVRRPSSFTSRRALFGKASAAVEEQAATESNNNVQANMCDRLRLEQQEMPLLDMSEHERSKEVSLSIIVSSPTSGLPDPARRVCLGAGAELARRGGTGLEMLLSPTKPRIGEMLAVEHHGQRSEAEAGHFNNGATTTTTTFGGGERPGAVAVGTGLVRFRSRRRLEY